MKWARWAPLIILVGGAWFTIAASALFLLLCGLWDDVTVAFPQAWFLAWWMYLWSARGDPETFTILYWFHGGTIATALVISGVAAAAPPLLLGAVMWWQRRYYQGWMMVMQGRPAAPWFKQPQLPTHGDASFARSRDLINGGR